MNDPLAWKLAEGNIKLYISIENHAKRCFKNKSTSGVLFWIVKKLKRKNKNAPSEMIPPQGGNACDLVRTTLDSLLEYHYRVKDSFTV